MPVSLTAILIIPSSSAAVTLILPLSIISLTIFTKWWYILPVDAPDSMMYGFPIPYSCNGWHTSLSYQIFIFEFIVDLLIHFAFITPMDLNQNMIDMYQVTINCEFVVPR